MSVSDYIGSLSLVCAYGLGVTSWYAHFVYGVLNGCLVCLLCKSCPGVCPVVGCVQNYRISAFLSVCFQLYGDACCTDSILVIVVVPDFSYTYGCLFRCVGVGQGCDSSVYTGICQAVAFRHVSLAPAVCDINSA